MCSLLWIRMACWVFYKYRISQEMLWKRDPFCCSWLFPRFMVRLFTRSDKSSWNIRNCCLHQFYWLLGNQYSNGNHSYFQIWFWFYWHMDINYSCIVLHRSNISNFNQQCWLGKERQNQLRKIEYGAINDEEKKLN